MCFGGYLLKIQIFGQTHVFGVNSKNLHPTNSIWYTNVNFSIKPTEATKSGVNGVGSVCSGHDDNVGSLFQTIHQCEQLGNDSSLDLSVSLFSLWSDGVQFINEDDCW